MGEQPHKDRARAVTELSGDGAAERVTHERAGLAGEALLGGRYRVLRSLASGGMGTVYEGEHALLGHRVAIKMLHPQYAQSEASTKRFMNEARAAAQLRHPNVARCDDVGVTAEGQPFLVLELLQGRDLAEELHELGPLELTRALAIARNVASALGHAHARGVVHRDLKPENVFLARDEDGREQVKVLDFGVARFIGLEHTSGTRTGAAIGTPLYMAPEQFTDASRVDQRADTYGLGVVIYEMLTGLRPYDAATLPELLSRMAKGQFARLDGLRGDVPPHVAAAVHAALSPDPAARPASMDAFVRMLDGATPVPEPPAAPARAPATKHVVRFLLVAALCLVAGLVAWALSNGTRSNTAVAAPVPSRSRGEEPEVAPPARALPPTISAPALEEPANAPTVQPSPAAPPEPTPVKRARRTKSRTPRDHTIADEPDF